MNWVPRVRLDPDALLEVAAEPELAELELAAGVAAGGAPAAAEGLYDETRDEHVPRAAAALELLREVP
jgi:hypothetical protein